MGQNLLSLGNQLLAKMLIDHASSPVTVTNGDWTITANATQGVSQWTSQNDDGVVIQFESGDFIVRASELIHGLPETGWVINDGERNYEVLSINGAQPYRFSDNDRLLVRIHTKEIE